ncbi:MAG: MFS transporter [Spirochaetota bacterium]
MARIRFTGVDYAASLGMFVYASSVVATPIILLRIADELSFSLGEGGGIEAVRAVFLLAILVASGVAAARFGKRVSLSAGSFVLGVGLLAYAFAPTYAVVLLAIVLVGLGGGVLEALLNPLVQDAHADDSGRYLNMVNGFFSVGVLTSVIVVGDLLTRGVSWRILIGAIGVFATGCGVFFLAVRDPAPARGDANASADAATRLTGTWHHARAIVREPAFWLFSVAMFCGGGAEGAFTFWSASYIQIHFDALARAGAIGTAAFAAGMVVGRLGFGRFVPQRGLRTLIIVSALTGVLASLGAWAIGTAVGFYAIVFAAGLSIACFWPSIQSHAAAVIPLDSTMLFILLSCAGIPGFGLTSWVMGLIAESYGLRASLLVIPGLLGLLAIVMLASPRPARRPAP